MVFPSRRAQVIDKSNIGDFEDSLKTEVDVMKSVQHRNIICMKEIFDSSDKLYIVLELVRSPKLV
jgi:serine/threonine protein kinase